MSGEIGIGVLGCGRIGRIHLANITASVPELAVRTVYDVAPDSALSAAEDYGIPRVAGDMFEVLTAPDVDAVLICTSTDTHASLIADAAAAGRAIFCEKPIAMDLETIDTALEAVERAGVPLQVGFNRRFDLPFRTIRDQVAAGAVGRVETVRVTSRDPEPPPLDYVRRSGGIFMDMMIHDFDMVRYLTGAEIVEVNAIGAVLVDPGFAAAGDVDTAVVTLTLDNGALGIIENSRRAVYGYDQRVEVFGSAGMLSNPNALVHPVHRTGAGGRCSAPGYSGFVERYADSYVREMKQFAAALVNGTVPPVTGADGRAPCVAGLAAGLSLAERRPVALSEIDRPPEEIVR